MRTLGIDIETYSPVDLLKSGVYPYVEHPDFEILLFAYAFDDEPVIVVDLAQGEKLPEEVFAALEDPAILKTAHNAAFERTCIDRHFGLWLDVVQWECTMVKSAMLGLPLSLAAVAKVLGIAEQKMVAGKALIKYFSVPCKPTKVNGGRTRNLPHHDIDKWNLFKEYCGQDVSTERGIRNKLKFFQIPEFEKRLYCIDQDINDRGVQLDMTLVHSAIAMDAKVKDKLTVEAVDLTGLDNPNSPTQLKDWLGDEIGQSVESLTKTSIPEIMDAADSDAVRRMLEIRQEMAKTSVKKYEAMDKAVCSDGRVRGLLQFYGANRTGRWAGRLVQVQNLPQNHLEDLDLAREVVRSGDLELVEMLFGNVPDTLSQLIRTAFVAKEGHTFLVADFSAIEARVIAWLADEKWRLDVFADGGDIYCASASQMFKVPVVKHGENGHLRQKGKIAELALGYQGGKGALETMGALRMGIEESELQPIVDAWRGSNPAIVKLWYEVGDAAMKAVEEGPCRAIRGLVTFEKANNILHVTLPSGRKLCYLRPRIGENRFGGKSLVYEGMDQTTKQWKKLETYGGKLVENIVQAIARDCLAVSMGRVVSSGFNIVIHIHDELVVEAPKENDDLDLLCKIMGQPISWAPGLPLKADGYVTDYYKKD